ncbi:MAG: glycosyltransferase [Cytophagales bacterium]|nr:MAG: glycosyltransferase [Cytophagales bacterium]
MIAIVLFGWLLVVGIQLVIILFVFGRLAFGRRDSPTLSDNRLPAVTIIVCARNEHMNLRDLVPFLASQDYPEFEVLVMDDRSTDDTDRLLTELAVDYPNVRTIRVDKEYDHVTPKKYALTIALKKALHPVVLLTDADCRPTSRNWLRLMIATGQEKQRDVVLGFSPYVRYPSFLNFMIRAETLSTAVQYLSLALAGRPYMGVGRNLAYSKDLFFENKGFYTHMNVLGGDDDLFINQVATARNTAVSLHPDTFVWSEPKHSWGEWRRQKRRHLNVGKFYKWGDKISLGVIASTHILSWVLALVVGAFVLWLALSGQQSRLLNDLLLVATGLFTLRLLTYWLVVGRSSYRLGHTIHWALMPVMDVVLAIYYSFSGLRMLFSKRKKQVW